MVRTLYNMALSPSAEFLKKHSGSKPFPAWVKRLLYLLAVGMILGCQYFTLSFSVVLNGCADCAWDSGNDQCSANDGSPDLWCHESCNETMCGTGKSLAMLWIQTVLIALAITLLVSQPMAVFAKRGLLPYIARRTLDTTGDFTGRVRQRVDEAERIAMEELDAQAREEERSKKRKEKEAKKREDRKAEREKKRGEVQEAREKARGDDEVDEVGAKALEAIKAKEEDEKKKKEEEEEKLKSKKSPRFKGSAAIAPAEEEDQVQAKEITAPPAEEVAGRTVATSSVEQRAADVRQQRAAMDDLRQQNSINDPKNRLLDATKDKPKKSKMVITPREEKSKKEAQDSPSPRSKLAVVPRIRDMPKKSGSAAAAEPDPDEIWTCPATGATMKLAQRTDFLATSPEYRECWQRILAHLVESLGKEETESRVSAVYKNRDCTADEAFCALAECGGDVRLARSKLKVKAYLNEMKLASAACGLGAYVSTKKRKRRKRRDGGKGEKGPEP